jgi:hypothetical protein
MLQIAWMWALEEYVQQPVKPNLVISKKNALQKN